MLKYIWIILTISNFTIANSQQYNTILVEHKTGGADGGYLNFLIIESENLDSIEMENVKLDKAYSLLPVYLIEKGSFKKLNKELKKIAPSKCSDTLAWGNLSITRYNSTDSIIYQRNLCCGETTVEQILKLSRKKSIGKYFIIRNFFDMLLNSLEETNPSKNRNPQSQ